MKKLIIFPFNGNGLEALDCLGNEYELIGFADDTPEKQGPHTLGFDVFPRTILNKYPEAFVLAVPGSPLSYLHRKNTIADLKVEQSRFATVVHPRASISQFAKIGHNTLLMAGVVVTSNACIGNHICMLPNTVIHHDSSIGDYSLLGSNITIAGNSTIHANCYIGSGSRIINGISIGEGTLVGLGSNVIKSLPGHVKAVGNPAKIIR
jgi:sugar O-acyltransferase (sialic acid O-acetyltransferase NeuD family)